MNYTLLVGNVIDKLSGIKPKSVQLAVSSPPYYRMRRYNCDFVWGGDKGCEHEWEGGKTIKLNPQQDHSGDLRTGVTGRGEQGWTRGTSSLVFSDGTTCSKCGAWKGELGWEESPELYVSHLCDVFDLARVALKDDGVCFVNLGDTFAGSQKGNSNGKFYAGKMQRNNAGSIGLLPNDLEQYGYKNKDLLLIPFLFASEMRHRGWYLRAEIPWVCPNKMPGPWKDRPIIGHEWFLMFTKSAKCSYDGLRVALPAKYAEEHASKSTSWGANRKHPNKNNVEQYAHTGDNHTTSEGGTRLRRTSDWFSDSISESAQFYREYAEYLESFKNGNEGLIVDETGDPLALFVNNRPSSLKHFAMYNEHLIEPLIKSSTVEGDTVLDPFSGTASTGACALRLGRKYIGIDAKDEYSGMARERLDKIESMPIQGNIFT